MRKKILMFFVILSGTLSLVSCGKENESHLTTANNTTSSLFNFNETESNEINYNGIILSIPASWEMSENNDTKYFYAETGEQTSLVILTSIDLDESVLSSDTSIDVLIDGFQESFDSFTLNNTYNISIANKEGLAFDYSAKIETMDVTGKQVLVGNSNNGLIGIGFMQSSKAKNNHFDEFESILDTAYWEQVEQPTPIDEKENSTITYETNLFSFSYNPDIFVVTQSETAYGTVYKIDSDMIPEVDQDTYNTVLGILEYRSTFYDEIKNRDFESYIHDFSMDLHNSHNTPIEESTYSNDTYVGDVYFKLEDGSKCYTRVLSCTEGHSIIAVMRLCDYTSDLNEKLYEIFDSIELQNGVQESVPETETESAPFYQIFGNGKYKVGESIEPGEYILINNDIDGYGYFCVSPDTNHDDITFNSIFDYNSIITINDGEYLELSDARAYKLDEWLQENSVSTNRSGIMLKVGPMLPPGEYQLTSTDDNGYYCVYSSSRQDDIITNDNFSGLTYVYVEEGQYLELNDCMIVQ